MAVRLPRPPRADGKKSRIVRAAPRNVVPVTGPILGRLTIVWVQRSGVPFNTTGFFARLSRGNTLVATAAFDSFGVLQFNNIRTPTNAFFTLRVFSPAGVLFRTRTLPPGLEAFAIIG